MSDEPRVTIHSPFFQPTIPESEVQSYRQGQKQIATAASREAAEREQAYVDALNRERRPSPFNPPPLKGPVLASDSPGQAAALDQKIFERGVAVDRAGLFALGKARFQELLEADHVARETQRISGNVDLASWPQVAFAFQQLSALHATSVPRRKSGEISSGVGKDREQAAAFNGFADLWKALGAGEPATVRNVYAFHNAFMSLVFGQSMLDRLSKDGRVHSHFFCGGRGRKVELFKQWIGVLQGSFLSVTLPDALWHVVAWLCNEQTPMPDKTDVARSWLNVRCSTKAQLRVIQSILDGFARGHTGWSQWEFVGRATRTVHAEERLSGWTNELRRSYPRIAQFHAESEAAFYHDIGGRAFDVHRQFDATRHRAFIDRAIQRLLDYTFALLALGIEEMFPGAVVARFEGSVLTQGNLKLEDSRTQIMRRLQAAFPHSTFHLEFTEAQS